MSQMPDVIFEGLFQDLHKARILKDQKAIADAKPKFTVDTILKKYLETKDDASFNIKAFFEEHFEIVGDKMHDFESDTSQSVAHHIERLWPYLERKPEKGEKIEGYSLIHLPYPYIVPGGRFNEIYYWDSYFTMLGLQVSERYEDIENMVNNFAYLIDNIGFIPNGNRNYFLGRSQPPFFGLMVELLVECKGGEIYQKYLEQLEKEYAFWMDSSSDDTEAYRRIVSLTENTVLNRYFDDYPTPRAEMYQHDLDDLGKTSQDSEPFFTHIKAACESGWDFSCRWFENEFDFASIAAANILPVDLNGLLYQLELTIAKAHLLSNNSEHYHEYKAKAQKRAEDINQIFWNEEKGYYFDYNFKAESQTNKFTLAGIFPLFFGIASPDQAARCAQHISDQFLMPGGVVSTPYTTGQQWDAPNGWAPLQWMTVKALLNYGHNALAIDVASRWMKLNEDVFSRTGKMMEKYNVVDLDLPAGGGEYEGQAGFGWTNGVYLKLKDLFQ